MKTKTQVFFNVLIGIMAIGGAFYMYNDFLLLEQKGGTRYMWIGFSIAYDFFGPYAAFIILIPTGLLFFYNAYRLFTGKENQEVVE